jgi:hypothetical protein
VDERHFTPDLAVLVQGLVDRGDWAAGNAIVFIITGSGVRTAESYDGEHLAAPILPVEYAPGVPVNSAPWVNDGPDAVLDISPRFPWRSPGSSSMTGCPTIRWPCW